MKSAAKRVDEAIADGMIWVGIGRDACIALIDAAVAEERARWLAWATDLGYDEQEFPK